MIHWLWLIPAAMFGGAVGLVATALFVVGGEGSDE